MESAHKWSEHIFFLQSYFVILLPKPKLKALSPGNHLLGKRKTLILPEDFFHN